MNVPVVYILCVLGDGKILMEEHNLIAQYPCSRLIKFFVKLCAIAFDFNIALVSIKLQRQAAIFLRFFASPKKVAKKGEI
jgi:hypothetical protein